MGLVLGRKPENETLCFSVESGFSRRWKVPRVCGLCGRARFVESVPPRCSATCGCSCVRSSMRFLNLWLQIAVEWLHDCCHLVVPCALINTCRFASAASKRIVMAAWMLHGACVGEEAGERNLVFFRGKWLQPAMKGTSCVRLVRLRSFHRRMGSPLVFCNVCFYAFLASVVADRIGMAAWLLPSCVAMCRYMQVCHVMLQNAF